jgi:hypothetical protein
MALPTSLGQRALQSLNRPSALQFIGTPQMGAPATQPVPQNIMGLRQKVLEQQMRPQMTPAQQFAQMTAGLPAMERTPAPDRPKGLGGLLSGMIPEAGTPEMAGIGAAGQKLLELSGYRQVPITTAEALGQAAGAFTQARGAALQQQKEEQAAQAAAERQAMLDARQARLDAMAAEKQAMDIANIKSQIKQREKPDAPKEPQLQEVFDPETGRPVKGYFNEANRFIRVGGLKAVDTKAQKKTGFVGVYTQDGKFVKNVREGSDEADRLAEQGFKIIESTQLTGTKKDLGLTTSVRGKIQTDIKDLEQAKAGLQGIKETFRPEMQTFLVRGEAGWKSLLEKGGVGLSDADEKLIADVALYKQNAWDAANRYIKYLTGAQMSEAEAKRILKSFPDPRLGFFEGDSPSQFKAKLDDALESVENSLARNYYFLNKGFDIEYVPDADPEKGENNVVYIDDRGRKIDIDDIPYLKDLELRRISEKYESPEYDNLSQQEKLDRIIQERDALFSSKVA